ncbi:uncharacterized protein LOC111292989 [Durio zibethinus]|uniref:Uncharacterized protein LOC111292989 n=1 Tax=Durio zibethinus TaxID=66656 RepID=A0A6P5YM91_DURZI|nr:uncharacterized protein LOC111292989 [Durio zibethinus]
MAKPRVTITLGGSGKVVKKGDDVVVDHEGMTGSKRFRHDKPWSDGGASNFISSNRRHRGNVTERRSGGSTGQGSRIAGNDLRFKLIRKRGLHHFRSAFNERGKRNSGKLSKDIRPLQNLSKHPCSLEPNRIENLGQTTHNGIKDGLHKFSLQNMDGSRGFSDMPQMVPTALASANLFSSNGVFYPSMETGLVPFTEKVIPARPVTYVAPMSSIMQRKPHVDEEPFAVATLLNSLGLGQYTNHFKAEEVDMTALRQMGDRDLKELGIPMGPRKKLLLALTPPSRRHLFRMRL